MAPSDRFQDYQLFDKYIIQVLALSWPTDEDL